MYIYEISLVIYWEIIFTLLYWSKSNVPVIFSGLVVRKGVYEEVYGNSVYEDALLSVP